MKTACLLATLLLLGSITVYSQSSQRNSPLTNAAVVKLVKAGFKEKTIISIISVREPKFDLSTDSMIALKRSGVSEKVMLAMLARQEGTEFDAEWEDDGVNRTLSSGNSSTPQKGAENETNIFGSSGGSQSEIRS